MSAHILPFALIALGGLVFAYGSQFPEYYDRGAEARLNDKNWSDAARKDNNADTVANEWYSLRASLRTRRDTCYDLGAGIIALGLGMALLFLTKGIRKVSDLGYLTTPKTSGRFYLLAALTWLSFIPGEWIYYIYTGQRGDYPPFADVIGIPMGGAFIIGVLGLPFVLFGVWVSIHGAKLPTAVWSGSIFGQLNIVSAAIWIALILALLVTAMGVARQPPIVPSCLFTLYLLLSGKAAAEQPANEPWGFAP